MSPHSTFHTPHCFRDIIERVAEFLQANESRLRSVPSPQSPVRSPQFDAERLTQSLVFHALQGTLAVVWNSPLPTPHSPLIGLALAWQTSVQHVYARQAAGRDVFDWKPTDPNGDCVYLALVISGTGILPVSPGDRRDACPTTMSVLATYFLDRFPHWRAMPTFAHRHGQLKSATGLLSRLSKLPTPHSPLIYG